MSVEVDNFLRNGYDLMDKSIEHLNDELSKVRAGKASPAMVSGLMVDYYGSPTPLPQVANVTTSDARTITIQPWEKSMLAPIERSIFESNMGMTPMNNGEVIILQIPPLTEERRLSLVKNCKALGEDAKVSVRNVRHKLMDQLKKEIKNGYPEDMGKKKEIEIQKIVDDHADKINKMIEAKEKDIMKI
jgi:ribosome recycling factor